VATVLPENQFEMQKVMIVKKGQRTDLTFWFLVRWYDTNGWEQSAMLGRRDEPKGFDVGKEVEVPTAILKGR